jgi:hypothetical protein
VIKIDGGLCEAVLSDEWVILVSSSSK